MESFGLRCGKAFSFLSAEEDQENRWLRKPSSFLHHQPKPKQIARACLTANLDNRRSGNTVSLSSSSPSRPIYVVGKEETRSLSCCNTRVNNKKTMNNVGQDVISPEKLDEWMHDSVSEIVRNIGKAPFLMNLYSNKGKIEPLLTSNITSTSTSNTTRLEIEKAVSDGWPGIRRRWEEGPIPDGIILVEQLKDEEEKVKEEGEANSPHSTTKIWGVLVQGRGVDCAACYILKTCRVCSSIGFCTHFCLVKAKCFGETAESQLKNSWI